MRAASAPPRVSPLMTEEQGRHQVFSPHGHPAGFDGASFTPDARVRISQVVQVSPYARAFERRRRHEACLERQSGWPPGADSAGARLTNRRMPPWRRDSPMRGTGSTPPINFGVASQAARGLPFSASGMVVASPPAPGVAPAIASDAGAWRSSCGRGVRYAHGSVLSSRTASCDRPEPSDTTAKLEMSLDEVIRHTSAISLSSLPRAPKPETVTQGLRRVERRPRACSSSSSSGRRSMTPEPPLRTTTQYFEIPAEYVKEEADYD